VWGGDAALAGADARVDDARREVDGEMSAVADAPVSADLSAWWAASPPAPDPLSAWWTGTAGSDPLHR
jgi:hypothetical protein